ncbi:MAG: hypothetical protein HYR68_08275 [Burkholderiales bacterium]|nr:hypothetical protein [Burkholderiales bacterium]
MRFLKFGLLFFMFFSIEARSEIQFQCSTNVVELKRDISAYFQELNISADLVAWRINKHGTVLNMALTTPSTDHTTTDFYKRAEFGITKENVNLIGSDGREIVVSTVSKKEIVLALLQHGRTTVFGRSDCYLDRLSDHVGVRQNVTAWAENLNWRWPEGTPAEWNYKYWYRGTPHAGVDLTEALLNAFVEQDRYSIGCYTGTKIVFAHAMLDYYLRVKKDLQRGDLVKKSLEIDGDPLVDVEPHRMWSFEPDFNPRERNRTGKILQLTKNVLASNFVPGDWAYIVNTDPLSRNKVGYEGSNAIYLGLNRFDDYYNDNDHSYTYEQKIDEVYQWRNGVFSRSHDAAKIRPLNEQAIFRLGKTPSLGGLVLNIRVVPRYF